MRQADRAFLCLSWIALAVAAVAAVGIVLLPWVVTEVEAHLSPDGQLSAVGVWFVSWTLLFWGSIALTGGLGLRHWVSSGRNGQLLTTLFRDRGRLFGLGWRSELVLGWLVTGCSTVAFLFLVFAGSTRRPLREDGPIESLQALLFAAGGLALFLALGRAIRFNSRRKSSIVGLGLLGLASLGVAGEEISWGQRIVGWETPQTWARLNTQGETNLHNLSAIRLGSLGFPIDATYVARYFNFVLVAAVWVSLLSRGRRRRLSGDSLLPAPTLLVPILTTSVVFWVFEATHGSRLTEGWELQVAWCAFLYGWNQLRTTPR